MRIEYAQESGITVTPTGMFDYCAGLDCIPQVEQLIAQHHNAAVTVDLSETSALDSSGLGALIALSRKLPEASPRLRLVHPSIPVQKLLYLCHLNFLFDIFPRQE